MDVSSNKLPENIAFDVEREVVFDQMSSHWDGMTGDKSKEHILDLIKVANVEGKTILDIGAGTGALLGAGLASSPASWIACDLSSQMLRILQEKVQDNPVVKVLHADVHKLPLQPHTVDTVICHNAFPHFHDPIIALTELYRVLKPGGMCIIDHSLSREAVNNIHRSADNKLLNQDLLEPVAKVIEWLQEVGYTVKDFVDNDQIYRIVATR